MVHDKKFRIIEDEDTASGVVAVEELIAPSITREFLLAGHAYFQVTNPKKEHYEFKIHRRTVHGQYAYFVRNIKTSRHLGVMQEDGTIQQTGRSVSVNKVELAVAQWAVYTVMNGDLIPNGYSIQHMNRCGVCGLRITETDVESSSKQSGFHTWCTI